MSDSIHETKRKPENHPIDKKEPGFAFLLPAITFMVVLVLGVLVLALFRAW
ncbi:hypothetical protein Poly24_32000 [Rosistilla carotiformis]|uniref:Uncharacterized protein n=1 Tax=Rosistilla carotiformis TaxID=2528017 RepID=A0A518JVB2_9BACT|nr:hypothetical protein [Rosistilla carotiformis]QDV69484.1 hypothetical protein Poly24_32000 [Rosistilla carotiformis]